MLNKTLFIVAVFLLSIPVSNAEKILKQEAGKKEFYENLHYKRVPSTQSEGSSSGRVKVVEMFFYACPHCNKLDPTLDKWLKTKSKNIEFKRVPAIIGPTWSIQARAFYVAQKLGIEDKIRKKLFKSIHDDGKQYYNEYTMMKFFSEQGVDPDKFLELYESKEVSEKAGMARELTVKYGIRGVPAIIVNNKYYTATYFTKNHEELLDVVDFLIEKEEKEQLALVK
ncbi:Periplasmic thiol:disulfide interchange protein DsbA [hydrothermal vent metagenome]|uniref:Thiol:disulfide interchange protein DsbA n=1 Tax=hydrothermal vent metagenome TaxID=652676 RepID=A0A3B0Y388_9ZZZZ